MEVGRDEKNGKTEEEAGAVQMVADLFVHPVRVLHPAAHHDRGGERAVPAVPHGGPVPPGKGIRVSADFDEHMAEGNEELLKQVWINILDNAVKFTPEGGEISLSIREGEGRISVEIRNTGSQLSPEDRSRMFRKFYQGDASHKTEGNGLGLSIAQKVVELHRGRIAAESGDGGTTFTVELPAPR